MNYTKFEQLVLGVATTTILGSILISLASNGWTGWPSFVSQLLLIPVLIAAVHYGRRAGLLTALIASAVFIMLKIPVLSAPEGVGALEMGMIALTIAAYGIVGIVGGDLCGRVKYLFGRFDNSATIDDWSRVFNQRKAAELLEYARDRFSRYGESFSVIVITQDPAMVSGLSPKRQRTLVREVAAHLRGDLRMVDEVARLDDGRFLVILPRAAREGALAVAQRLIEAIRQMMDADQDGVSSQCFSAAEDDLELGSLFTNIAPQPATYEGSSS
ncbi:MAG: hypothetical protein WCJ13_00205 [Coriobacteriia bacterium]